MQCSLESKLFFDKLTFFSIGKQAVFLEIFKDLLNDFHMILTIVFIINLDVIKVQNDKNIKFFR